MTALPRVSRAALLAMAFMALSLAACGKKGAPLPPGPADKVIYPHAYPSY